MSELGDLLVHLNRLDEAEPLVRQALEEGASPWAPATRSP